MNKEITFIGLGRMGMAMSTQLIEQGFTVHGYDVLQESRSEAETAGVRTYYSIKEALEAQNQNEKVVWLMVPSKHVGDVLDEAIQYLTARDIIIDGGNSFFKDSVRRHDDLADRKIRFIDCGTSGGVLGARTGASLMVGGELETVRQVEHIFTALAVKDGYGHVGGPGAGHFVKMIHNGIEYGMMGALAEGVNILEDHKEGLSINISEALKAYEHGSIISSKLTTWLAQAYNQPNFLEQIAGSVPKGETEMEMEYIVNHNHARVLQAAVTQRKLTRLEPSVTGTLISAMRNMFGGHVVHKKSHEDHKQ